jgi:Flp pilus assembly pilin Flp
MGSSEEGQGLVEYAILISLVAISSLLVLQVFGVSVGQLYCDVAEAINLKSACTAKAICEDTFDSLDNWKTHYGKPLANQGQVCLSKGVQMYNLCSMEANVQNYTVRLENAYLYQGDGYGIFFRTSYNAKGANGYIFQYDPGLKAFVIRKWINGKEIWQPIAKTPIPKDYPIYNTPHTVEIRVQDNLYTVILDGEKILEATDDTYTKGGIGLRTWDDTQFCGDQISLLSNP